jgi:hypothetical protein
MYNDFLVLPECINGKSDAAIDTTEGCQTLKVEIQQNRMHEFDWQLIEGAKGRADVLCVVTTIVKGAAALKTLRFEHDKACAVVRKVMEICNDRLLFRLHVFDASQAAHQL